MKTDLLACRHIGVNKADAEVMLRKIGVASLDELIDKTIPANIRLKAPLALPAPMTEYEFATSLNWQAKTNCSPLISVWDGTTRSPLQSSSEMYSRIRSGILLILLTRQKFRKEDWKP